MSSSCHVWLCKYFRLFSGACRLMLYLSQLQYYHFVCELEVNNPQMEFMWRTKSWSMVTKTYLLARLGLVQGISPDEDVSQCLRPLGHVSLSVHFYIKIQLFYLQFGRYQTNFQGLQGKSFIWGPKQDHEVENIILHLSRLNDWLIMSGTIALQASQAMRLNPSRGRCRELSEWL